MAGCGHSDRVFELRRERAVLGDRGPAVAENFDLVAAGVDHWFDREEHSLAQLYAFIGMTVMQDGRGIVKDAPDAVTAEIAHDRIPMTLGVALDCVTDGPDADAGTHDSDAAHHRLVGDIDQPSRLDRD